MKKKFSLIFIVLLQGCTSSELPVSTKKPAENVNGSDLNTNYEKNLKDITGFYFDGMITLMMYEKLEYAGALGKYFLKRTDVLDARVIANDKIYKEKSIDQPQDELSNKIFAGYGKPIVVHDKKTGIMSISVPMTATENTRGVNCTVCHKVPIGTVLGVLRMEYSLYTRDAQTADEFKSGLRNYLCSEVLPKKAC